MCDLSWPTALNAKTKWNVLVGKDTKDQVPGHCKLPGRRCEDGKTEIDSLCDCLGILLKSKECPFIYKICMLSSGNNQIYSLIPNYRYFSIFLSHKSSSLLQNYCDYSML